MNENQSEPHLPGGQESGVPAQGVKVAPAWKCAGIIVNPAPDYQTAFNQLDQISRLMYGVPCPDPPTGDLGTQLQALMSGNAAMNVIASLSTRPQFIELIWRVAMGAAFDYCVNLLGLQCVQEIQDLKQEKIDQYFQAYQLLFPTLESSIDPGWMIASILSSPEWANLGLDCNQIP
jgi:hypothetical protein